MKPRLPLTVISGYLGAGKTTLINRLLAEPHGVRLLVMVNDFGAINIDAELLASQTEDTLTLSNGCVCCTMGADLFMAVGDVLDRDVRPDHLIIEASGIADPARIAQVAQAEPELIYGGILTVVDAQGYVALTGDPQIGPQVAQQVRVADLVALSKTTSQDAALQLRLSIQSGAEVFDLNEISQVFPALIAPFGAQVPLVDHALHHPYVAWQHCGAERMALPALNALFARRPEALFRVKGFVCHDADTAWEVHCVGPTTSIKALPTARETQLVGIGLKDRITLAEIDAWWATRPF